MNDVKALAFEIAKYLAHNGCSSDAPAFAITWGQVAEAVAQVVVAHELPADRLAEETVLSLAETIREDLVEMDGTGWRVIVLDRVMTNQTINPALWEPEYEPDEGPLVVQYENATRLGDDESYWADGGESADFFS